MPRIRLRDKLKARRRLRGTHAAAPPQRGLGEPPSDAAGDAELDALRGELVRELDKRAADQRGPACLRRA